MLAALGTARPRLEIDVAFGEAVTPAPQEVDLPVLLSMPSPRLRAYRRETAIAEKCEAMVSLGITNTRMKDFFDLWYLSRTYDFDGEQLCSALRSTFTRRRTAYPAGGLPTALSSEFIADPLKRSQWNAFIGKSSLKEKAADLPQLLIRVQVSNV
jgi:predicted nucleotidyltransferase component of viral defense system